LATKSQQAKQAMDAGRFEEATTIYRELVRALPRNPGLRLNLGLALHSAGHYREAIQQFQTAVKLQPDLGPAWLMLGLGYQKLQEPAQALEPLRRALRNDRNNRTALLELADACLSTGRAAEAAEHFQKLAELDPGNPKAWQGLGLSFVELSRRSFDQLEKAAPDSAYWYVLLARSFDSQNKLPTAFYLYRQALALAPNLRGVHAALAAIYRRTGRADWAATEEAKERKLPHPDCSTETLECDFVMGRYAQVIARTQQTHTPEAYYWRALASEKISHDAFTHLSQLPATQEVHELMGESYRIQGLYAESAREWQEALKAAPQDWRVKKELAHVWWLSGDCREAQPLLAELARLDATSPDMNLELGDCLLKLGAADQAVPYLEKAVQSSPKLLQANDSLARAYLQTGRPEKVIPQLNAALDIDKEGRLHYQLARAYSQIGKTQLAKQTMQKFQEITKATQSRRQQLSENYQITPP
jgi:tetratricopeptide (TPR) repeat protein